MSGPSLARPRPWLAPLGHLFGAAAGLRRGLYRRGLLPRTRLQGPVISVGNLSVGGSGKTPVVELVAGLVRDAGLPVAVLSRGYGGSFRGEALIVSDGSGVLADAAAAGDEPVMLARALPGVVVAVGPRRERVGRAVEERHGRRVHVLDDGFQHLRLHRDLDLVCVAAADLGGRPLPAGWLRERPSALACADLVLLAEGAAEAGLPAETLRLRRFVVGLRTPEGAPCPAPRRVWLLAGIARPERFAADAARQVEAVAGQDFFPDHHRFTPEELARVEARARAAGADALLTTAKDLPRLPAGWSALPVRVLCIRAEVDRPELLRERVLGAVRSRW